MDEWADTFANRFCISLESSAITFEGYDTVVRAPLHQRISDRQGSRPDAYANIVRSVHCHPETTCALPKFRSWARDAGYP